MLPVNFLGYATNDMNSWTLPFAFFPIADNHSWFQLLRHRSWDRHCLFVWRPQRQWLFANSESEWQLFASPYRLRVDSTVHACTVQKRWFDKLRRLHCKLQVNFRLDYEKSTCKLRRLLTYSVMTCHWNKNETKLFHFNCQVNWLCCWIQDFSVLTEI